MTKNIALVRGDGIGPEIVGQAKLVLDKIAEIYGHEFVYTDVDMGGNAIDKWGDPLPKEMLDLCLASDSVLLGAVGGPKWNSVPGNMRPEKGLLRLRAGMGVYSNNRPAKIWPQLASASPLKQEIVDKGEVYKHLDELDSKVTDAVNRQTELLMQSSRDYQAAVMSGRIDQSGAIGNLLRMQAQRAVNETMIYLWRDE